MRSIVCNPSKTEWKHHEVMYVINPNRKNIQGLRLDDIPFASQTDYILAYARIHTNPSDWITKKERRFFFVLFLCWHRPIFPGRFQPSIFGTDELNFCVRNGNRWTLTANDTNYLYYTLSFLRIQYLN